MTSASAAAKDVGSDARLPSVSVVITCFNHGRFLGEAIESVLTQSYRPLEIIVVDDGSTDTTAEVVSLYRSVQYVSQANLGLAAARNTGLRRSRGQFVVFLDADDLLLPAALAQGIKAFHLNPECGLVYGGHRTVNASRSLIWQGVSCIIGEQYSALLQQNHIGMHGAVMYRCEALKAVGAFNPAFAACEDYDVYLRMARRYQVYCHQNVVAEYRRHETNMTRDPALILTNVLAVLEAQRPHISGNETYMRAYKEGVRFYRNYYGRRLLYQVVTGFWEPRQRVGALRGALIWLRSAPGSLPTAAAYALELGVRKARMALPPPVRRLLSRVVRRVPAAGRVDFGDLRRVNPIDGDFGFTRGQPVDRYYIEGFLARQAADVRGCVLEVGDSTYTRRFGGEKVGRSDVLHVAEGNPAATIVGDLTRADHLPPDAFDCVILTQTLHLIYDVRAALGTLYRILKPGGIVLATFPGISQIDRYEWQESWCWSFTAVSARRLFEESFEGKDVTVESHGNVLAAVAFLHGLSVQELDPRELDYHDPSYPLLIAVRAMKAEAAA